VADSSNVSIINSIVVLNAPPTETTKVIITEVTHNVTTTITLLPDNPVPVPLGGNFAT
jgi:hypothetical protein